MSADEFDDLERRIECDRQRLPIEEAARKAKERGELLEAATLWQKAQELAVRYGDGMSRWYVDGQLADVLIEMNRHEDAQKLLEASLAAGNDIPFAHSLLVDIYMGKGQVDDACRVRRAAWRSVSARAQRNGMPAIDPSPQIEAFAKWWKTTGGDRPIELAEKWAEEANARDAWFAVRHERGQRLEKTNATAEALELYLELIRQGTRHEPTYVRALMLLVRAKRSSEALAVARSVLALGLSAKLEERARKTIGKLEAEAAAPTADGAKARKKQPKAIVPAFSIRAGEQSLQWQGQIDLKGGARELAVRQDGLLVTSGGTDPAIWWLATGSSEPTRIRAIPKRTRLCCGYSVALISDEGTVNEGSARVEMLDAGLDSVSTVSLPGVTSEVVATVWGLAIGCRAGGLHAIDWQGNARWRFEVPQPSEVSSFGRPCPYFVSAARDGGTVVFSSFQDLYALRASGQIAWKWHLPAPAEQRIGSFISIQMPAASISAVTATMDGGAWVAAQTGEIFRIDQRGRVTWSAHAPGNVSQLITDANDGLVAVVHSGGVALVGHRGLLSTVIESPRWPKATRAADGRHLLTVEGKVLQLVDPSGNTIANLEFSRSVEGVALAGATLVVAAGKLVMFGLRAPTEGT